MDLQNKRKKMRAGSFLVIMFLLIYMPSLVHWLWGKSVDTEILKMGTIEDVVSAEAYLVRDEEVLKTPFEGKCITGVKEGDKVPAGYKVATILNESSEKVLEKIRELDVEIIKAQKEKFQNQEIFMEDIGKIEDEIAQKVELIQEESSRNSLVNVKQLREDINGLIQKKASIFGQTSTSDTFINSLKAQKLKLQEQINSNTREIYSSTPGIISYMIDGNEGTLTPAAISNLTPESLKGLKTDKVENTALRNHVEANKPFAKIIKDVYSYMVFVLEPERAKKFKVDDAVKVRVGEISREMDGVVDYKSDEEEGKFIIAVKIDRGISEMAGLRKVNADIVRNSYKGLKIPLKSLKDISPDGTRAKIVLVDANYAKTREVKIVGRDEEFAIIANAEEKATDGISLYCTYVANPGNVQEGQVINQ
ncbi:MAG: HlyD family efflux transporter periplasmic adaptor subunit [Clostridiales bacterium]|jgi:putative membrane fusion protein|nr:hypothetical protein [Eubacteriales bacterium]MDH7565215.1 HlyD family efflux transporter periplasmic adaptor subunit [Clostridiales bacterium]